MAPIAKSAERAGFRCGLIQQPTDGSESLFLHSASCFVLFMWRLVPLVI